jgi:hypothetical protein
MAIVNLGKVVVGVVALPVMRKSEARVRKMGVVIR